MGDTTAPDSAAPQVRVGDTERRAVDDRLMAAVGEGVLTLSEYDERSLALWQARTRAELDALVADLPPTPVEVAARPAATPAEPAPVQPGSGYRRRGVVARTSSRLAGLAVPLAVLGGVVVAGPDGAAVFGSSVEQVSPATEQVQVSTLFGSVTVVVPDGARVDTSGIVVFGSLDCERACSGVFAGSDDTGQVVRVRGLGGFGSVEVLTQTEYAAAQRADRLEELQDELEDELDDELDD